MDSNLFHMDNIIKTRIKIYIIYNTNKIIEYQLSRDLSNIASGVVKGVCVWGVAPETTPLAEKSWLEKKDDPMTTD